MGLECLGAQAEGKGETVEEGLKQKVAGCYLQKVAVQRMRTDPSLLQQVYVLPLQQPSETPTSPGAPESCYILYSV